MKNYNADFNYFTNLIASDPYIATAKIKGEWNIEEYPNELNTLFKEYKINNYGNL